MGAGRRGWGRGGEGGGGADGVGVGRRGGGGAEEAGRTIRTKRNVPLISQLVMHTSLNKGMGKAGRTIKSKRKVPLSFTVGYAHES